MWMVAVNAPTSPAATLLTVFFENSMCPGIYAKLSAKTKNHSIHSLFKKTLYGNVLIYMGMYVGEAFLDTVCYSWLLLAHSPRGLEEPIASVFKEKTWQMVLKTRGPLVVASRELPTVAACRPGGFYCGWQGGPYCGRQGVPLLWWVAGRGSLTVAGREALFFLNKSKFLQKTWPGFLNKSSVFRRKLGRIS